MIGKQAEEYENCTKFLKLAKEKKVKVIAVEAGDTIKVDKYMHFDVMAR